MEQKIKVLHLIDSLSVGGAERLLVNLANRIDSSRFEFYVCALRVLRGNALQTQFERLSAPPHIINAQRLYDPKALFAVAQYVRKHNIDIIHTQLTYADITGRVVGKLLGRPVISTLQNEPQEYDRDRIDRRLLARFTARYLSTALVAVSQRVHDQFVQQWHIPQARLSTIYNAVPMENYTSVVPERATNDAGRPVITNIGRLTTQKAQHLFIAAAKIVLQHHPNARFLIVGQGHLQQQLAQQATELGIAEQVTLTGVRHDIADILAQSDIFVLSSLWEGLPLTAVEAMAAACPVVLTDVGGNRELVESGVQGLIVPPGDVEALAAALTTLLDDPQRRVAMGKAARERVRHDFSITTIAKQYEALYQRISKKRHNFVGKQYAAVSR